MWVIPPGTKGKKKRPFFYPGQIQRGGVGMVFVMKKKKGEGLMFLRPNERRKKKEKKKKFGFQKKKRKERGFFSFPAD